MIGSTPSCHNYFSSSTSVNYESFGRTSLFLGRVVQRNELGIHLRAPKPYVYEMVDLLGLGSGKAVGTMGTSSPTKRERMALHTWMPRATAPTEEWWGNFSGLCPYDPT